MSQGEMSVREKCLLALDLISSIPWSCFNSIGLEHFPFKPQVPLKELPRAGKAMVRTRQSWSEIEFIIGEIWKICCIWERKQLTIDKETVGEERSYDSKSGETCMTSFTCDMSTVDIKNNCILHVLSQNSITLFSKLIFNMTENLSV